ncbi:MAG TPA: c-type cytochrome, partial [Acidobacteriota bacterium]
MKAPPILLILFFSTLAWSQKAGQQLLPEDPLAGANVFVQKKCVQCHSIKSKDLSNRLGPNLGNIHLKGSFLDIAAIMWNHAPFMIQKMEELRIETPKFTGKEMANLVAFLTAYQYYLKEVGHPGDPAKGEIAWKGKQCSACHAFEENWSKVGPSLRTYRSSSPIQM